jgi:hypothetical protein
MVHPDKAELKLFVNNELTDQGQIAAVAAHVAACEFCAEFRDVYLAEKEGVAESSRTAANASGQLLADRLLRQARAGQVIDLTALPSGPSSTGWLLAADGVQVPEPPATNLLTLYSEKPDLVLRAMRDHLRGVDYLQLIGDDSELIANVLIQLPAPGLEYVTDSKGKVVLEEGKLSDVAASTWKVKLPDAWFEMQPLVYDPEKIESACEVSLETDQRDRILVTLIRKTEGKQVVLKVLELDGNTEYGNVRVAICQQDTRELKPVRPNQSVVFSTIDPDKEISIRIYR